MKKTNQKITKLILKNRKLTFDYVISNLAISDGSQLTKLLDIDRRSRLGSLECKISDFMVPQCIESSRMEVSLQDYQIQTQDLIQTSLECKISYFMVLQQIERSRKKNSLQDSQIQSHVPIQMKLIGKISDLMVPR